MLHKSHSTSCLSTLCASTILKVTSGTRTLYRLRHPSGKWVRSWCSAWGLGMLRNFGKLRTISRHLLQRYTHVPCSKTMVLTSLTWDLHPHPLGYGPKNPISGLSWAPRPSLSYAMDIITAGLVS